MSRSLFILNYIKKLTKTRPRGENLSANGYVTQASYKIYEDCYKGQLSHICAHRQTTLLCPHHLRIRLQCKSLRFSLCYVYGNFIPWFEAICFSWSSLNQMEQYVNTLCLDEGSCHDLATVSFRISKDCCNSHLPSCCNLPAIAKSLVIFILTIYVSHVILWLALCISFATRIYFAPAHFNLVFWY